MCVCGGGQEISLSYTFYPWRSSIFQLGGMKIHISIHLVLTIYQQMKRLKVNFFLNTKSLIMNL